MKNILIIDDDPRIVSALQVRLQAGGYATAAAGDAVTGRNLVVELLPDLILLDLTLPYGDGLSLARQLRTVPETRATPIIFITAHQDENLRARTMEVDAAGLFEKPYDADELLAVIAHALGETGTLHRPLARYTAPNTAATAPRLAPAPVVKTILIVEDDPRIAMALALRLKTAGYETALAHDARAGIDAALNERPDLVLLDISLPEADGFTVAERIQESLAAPPPIIFLTASKRPEFRERATQLGAAGFFEKPYEHATLLAAVREQLESY